MPPFVSLPPRCPPIHFACSLDNPPLAAPPVGLMGGHRLVLGAVTLAAPPVGLMGGHRLVRAGGRTTYRSGLARPVCSWLLPGTCVWQNGKRFPFCHRTALKHRIMGHPSSRASMTKPWPVPPSGPGVWPNGSVVNQAREACDLVKRVPIRRQKRRRLRFSEPEITGNGHKHLRSTLFKRQIVFHHLN